jgi:hypothetical protein
MVKVPSAVSAFAAKAASSAEKSATACASSSLSQLFSKKVKLKRDAKISVFF